jgi:polyhydroxyalkanoate synthesis regulator phasin
MDSNTVIETLKKGVRVSLGATTAVVESLQDTQKREENLASLRLGPAELTELWAQKGEKTEEEARKVMDDFLTQNGLKMDGTGSTAYQGNAAGASASSDRPFVEESLQEGLRNLTTELEAIRQALTQPPGE